ncbi:YhgE/Pip domain-containing protein [Agromyces atrinae]|uniref:Putative membrane protein n=1 Tax=Agromyces atrinae TaxID=592376 RepID=A0A4Q2MGM8_9MICO|nr:YhgE/Pip domain-containing protein [Agromyces atrinae]NYD67466.1 putative membrane protein [Agromyces atrinae]RXZ88310.1 YhgE/Pip domain-containing protein [Agromyces atrinae]
MNGIWQLFREDLRRATRNVMSVIVLCGLVIIPSVFTWFNVIASWEPFDNTKNLKVAVASIDEGYTSTLVPLHINVGSMVESNLRANDQMDWIITSKADAVAGTESGEYYAAMVLPADFSERMLTFYAAGSPQTQIDYYTNDKSNPLAPLITSEGADDLSAKINAEFTQELDTVALAILSSLASSLDDPQSQATFQALETQIGAISTQLRSASGTAGIFSSLVASSVPLAQGSLNLLGAVESEFTSATGAIRQGVDASAGARRAISDATAALSSAFTATDDRLARVQADVDTLFDRMGAETDSAAAGIDTIAADVGALAAEATQFRDAFAAIEPDIPAESQPEFRALLRDLDVTVTRIEGVQSRLTQAAIDVREGNVAAQSSRAALDGDVEQARSSLARAANVYTADVLPLLDALGATLAELGTSFGSLSGDLSFVDGVAQGSVSMLERAAVDTGALAGVLATSADAFEVVHDDLAAALASGDVEKLAQVIGSDPATLAAALAQPIGLDRIAVYPVVSFGAGMAPLYTVLSLWVGALLLSVTLRVEPPTRAYDGGPELTLNQQFLGRYGIFALIGFLQSTLVFLGNILIVGLDPVHPFLFMLVGWSTSLVFTFVIYTLVVSFSDAGKALAVFLLVIQVAGAGGAYPLELLPQWFQNASPFLPATHAIDAIRAALAGIYRADYWIALGWLWFLVLPALLLGLALRKPLIGLNKTMEGMLQSTKLM